MTDTVPDLAGRLLRQAATCDSYGSRLYGVLLAEASTDLLAGGPTAQVLAGAEADPPGSVPALRLMGALHHLVLARRAPLLATHYPSVGGEAGPTGAWAAARALLAEEPEAVRALVGRPVQTNETGRQAVLFGVLAWLTARTSLPVRLLEVGASGGLNLRPETAAYRVDGRVRGSAGSPLLLDEPWAGTVRPPDVAVRVAARAGCDPLPVDVGTTTGRLTLTSFVWADMTERLARLRAAFALTDGEAVQVRREGGAAFLARELAEAHPAVLTVVWHSVVMQYVDPAERAEVRRILDAALGRATPDAPVAYASMEPQDKSGTDFDVRVRLGAAPEVLLATCRGHGPPVVWEPVAAG